MTDRPELDGLCAVAVLPVGLFHAGIAGFAGGFVGVDGFFVISGYLITTILLTDLEAGQFSLGRFYERRARRLLPALALVASVTLPAAWVLLLPDDMVDYAESLAGVVRLGRFTQRAVTGDWGQARFHEVIEAGFAECTPAAMATLQEAGHPVSLVRDFPTLNASPEACLFTARLLPRPARCDRPCEVFDRQTRAHDATLDQVTEATGAAVPEVADEVCSDSACSMFDGDTLLCCDSTHVNMIGRVRPGTALARQIGRAADGPRACARPAPML